MTRPVPVAQLDRATVSEAVGLEFESRRARFLPCKVNIAVGVYARQIDARRGIPGEVRHDCSSNTLIQIGLAVIERQYSCSATVGKCGSEMAQAQLNLKSRSCQRGNSHTIASAGVRVPVSPISGGSMARKGARGIQFAATIVHRALRFN